MPESTCHHLERKEKKKLNNISQSSYADTWITDYTIFISTLDVDSITIYPYMISLIPNELLRNYTAHIASPFVHFFVVNEFIVVVLDYSKGVRNIKNKRKGFSNQYICP